jgi:hypothetical protein
MTPNLHAAKLPLSSPSSVPVLDIVVPFMNRPLARAALAYSRRLSVGLLPRVRMFCIRVLPFPLELETAPLSPAVLSRQLAPIAGEFGAHLQVCFARDLEQGLLHLLSKDSVLLIAAASHWWRPWLASPEVRIAKRLQARGYNVVLKFVEKNDA